MRAAAMTALLALAIGHVTALSRQELGQLVSGRHGNAALVAIPLAPVKRPACCVGVAMVVYRCPFATRRTVAESRTTASTWAGRAKPTCIG
jgi:hypothetical protein